MEALVAAAVAFAATNIDDILVLTVLFSQTGSRLRKRDVVMGQYLGFVALVAIALGIGSLFRPKGEGPGVVAAAGLWGVAVLTIANGGDNIGIYTPLFASSDPTCLLITVAAFLVLVAVWCFAGYRLARVPQVARVLSERGQVLVPFVLIGLGVYIIAESRTISLLGW